MDFQDKKIICKDCNTEFIFTAGEQRFYAEKGFSNDPVRCPNCRASRKRFRSDKTDRAKRMYEVVCDGCGEKAKVPFEPTGTKPIYCKSCFEKSSLRR